MHESIPQLYSDGNYNINFIALLCDQQLSKKCPFPASG